MSEDFLSERLGVARRKGVNGNVGIRETLVAPGSAKAPKLTTVIGAVIDDVLSHRSKFHAIRVTVIPLVIDPGFEVDRIDQFDPALGDVNEHGFAQVGFGRRFGWIAFTTQQPSRLGAQDMLENRPVWVSDSTLIKISQPLPVCPQAVFEPALQ